MPFKKTLKNASFRSIWISQFISAIGDGVWTIALPLLVLEITGDKVMVGIITFIELLPLVFSFFIGPFIDRLNKKLILLTFALGKGSILLILYILYKFNLLNIEIIAFCTFLLAVQSVFFTPTKTALVPILIRKEELGRAVSIMNISELVAQIIGKLVSGVLITIASTEIVFLIDSILLYLSAYFIFIIEFKEKRINSQEKFLLKKDLGDALSKLKANSDWITSITYFFLINLIISGLISVIVPIISVERFDKSYAIWFSLMQVSFQIGMAVGNIVVFLNLNIKNLLRLFPKVILLLGIILIIISFPLNGFECLIFFMLGSIISYIDIQTVLYFQKTIPENYIGRIFSIVYSIIKLGESLSVGLYTLLLLFVSTKIITLYFGIIILLFFILVLCRDISKRQSDK